jgi:prevent-host-death family protein
MTMVTKFKTVAAGEFKAHCLRLIDEVKTHGTLIITKRGKPVAKLMPLDPVPTQALTDLIEFQDDLISPIDTDWEANS